VVKAAVEMEEVELPLELLNQVKQIQVVAVEEDLQVHQEILAAAVKE
jgi:hypothetical protein